MDGNDEGCQSDVGRSSGEEVNWLKIVWNQSYEEEEEEWVFIAKQQQKDDMGLEDPYTPEHLTYASKWQHSVSAVLFYGSNAFYKMDS